MKRLCQWPYLVIAILVITLFNGQSSQSQELKTEPVEQLILTAVKTTDGQKVRISVGDVVLEATEIRALHKDGSQSIVKSSPGMVKLTHKSTSMEARVIAVPIRNGFLSTERRPGIKLDSK